jgi:capsular polysaccharide biosynthesis protein
VTLPPALCLEGPLPAAWRPLLGGGATLEVPAPVAARCGGLRVLGQGILLWGERGRLRCASHYHGSPREHPGFLPEFRLYLGPYYHYDEADHPRLDLARQREVRLRGPTLVLAQPGCRTFGHWLVQILPRLRLAQRLGLPTERYLLPAPLPGELRPLMAAYGVTEERIAWMRSGEEVARLDDGVICASLQFGRGFSPLASEVLADLRRHLVPHPPARPWRRLYLSRRAWRLQNRRLRNRQAVGERLAAAGFQELVPETLSIRAQAALLAEASHVVAEDGSACHLMLYAAPAARLLVLQPANRCNDIHNGLAQALGQQVGYVVGATEQVAPRGAPVDYGLDLRDLERGLAALLA